ncbi:MAG: hypothetical protein K9N49_04155, partial [Candidatus Marinimicrobia bacterium]|nr:hypothetical protein [Candidatus Neomarinimicrobiota bacterium]
MRKRETSKLNAYLAGALRAAVAVAVLAPAWGWAGTGPLWRLAFEGERPLDIQGAGAALANSEELAGRLTPEGLMLETGAAGPLIETTDWDSDAGTLAFWI